MALDVWFRNDISNTLDVQAQMASRYPPGDFRDGYMASLEDTATAFGVEAPKVRRVTRMPPDIIDVGGDYG